jgi:hypothetical protein
MLLPQIMQRRMIECLVNNESERSERKPVTLAGMPVENWHLKLEVRSWKPVSPARKLAAEVPAEASG